MKTAKTKLKLLSTFSLLILFHTPALSQLGYQFGQNKVHYKDFDWSVLSTEHFDVYYYDGEAEAARDAARMAERGYDYLSDILNHKFKKKIPLLLYASVNDFQQTNVIQGLVGDGTRGVTESSKTRVALPITGSYREFNHVLVHELVHAFQFDIMLNRKPSRIQSGRFNPPLWFVEGMAEYLSVGMDNITRMWVRDGLENDNLLTVSQLNNTYDIRVYRLGESLWYHIGEKYGKKKVGELLKTASRTGNLDFTFKSQLGLTPDELTEDWHKSMQSLVFQDKIPLKQPGEIAKPITRKTGYYHLTNIVPSVSPDGKQIVYIANKNLKDDLFILREQEDGKIEEKQLVEGGESKQFESLQFFDTAINWSRDGKKIAFISKAGKDDAIYIMDPFKEEILNKLRFDDLNGLSSPAFSPDGENLVFVGMRGGISDLYVIRLASGAIERLTSDKYAELHPNWSPDGKLIVFATDRGSGTDVDKLLFGDLDLAVYDLETKAIEMITELDGNAINPQWIHGGTGIAFLSDHQGIPNIYHLRLADGAVTTITLLKNGVSGITATTPAFSVTPDGKHLVFSSFVKGAWQLFRMSTSNEQNVLAGNGGNGHHNSNMATLERGSFLPSVPEPNDFLASYGLSEADSIENRDYGTRLQLEAVSAGGAFGSYLGSVGAAQFLFSDMLGNQNLILSAGLRFTNPLHSDLGLAYLNQGRRLNYGAQLFQTSEAYGIFASFNSQGFVRQTYRGGSVFAQYPFSRFSRVEASLGLVNVSQELVVDDYRGGDRSRQSLDLGGFYFGQVGGAYVFDNTTYGPIGPLQGSRSRLSVETTTNDLRFTTLLLDFRRYMNIKQRSVLAYRLFSGASLGRDSQIFRIGGAYNFRGTQYGELLGSKFLVQNVEYRFPLLPFLSGGYDFLSGVTFFDAAATWGEDIPGYIKSTFQPFSSDGGFGFKDLHGAFGLGARLNLGYLSLRYDIAWPTDLRSFDNAVHLFSIGSDF